MEKEGGKKTHEESELIAVGKKQERKKRDKERK